MLTGNEKYQVSRQQCCKILTIVNSYVIQPLPPANKSHDCPGVHPVMYHKEYLNDYARNGSE